MPYATSAFLLVSIILADVVFASAQVDANAQGATAAHLKKFNADYINAVSNKKPEILQAYYGENVRLMPGFQKTIIGKTNALSYHKAFAARFDIKSYARNQTEILDLGKQVAEYGIFTMNMTVKGTGKLYNVKGKYVTIWEKGNNSTLLLITEAWNYDHAMDIEDQFRFSEVPYVDVALQAHVPVNNPISFELAALNRLMEATVSQHDAKIWSQFYTDDAILFSQRYPIFKGRNAIDQYLETHAKELPVFEKLDLRNDRIDDLGKYVIEYASHIANWRAGEYSGVGVGKDLRIWRRESNGSLKIFWHIGMYD